MDAKIQCKGEAIDKPDFGKIFQEMAEKRNLSDPVKQRIASQADWSCLDVIKMNEKLFDTPTTESLKFNQNHKAYDKKSIKEILDYQKKKQA